MNKKTRSALITILIVIVFAAAAVTVIMSSMQTTEEHYAELAESTVSDGSVTLTVSCAELLDNELVPDRLKTAGVIPSDGMIIPESTRAIADGDTAFSVLRAALGESRVLLDYSDISERSVYVRGINNIYEYDCGDLSGWMYSVNGIFPTISSSEYVLHDGDEVVWQYTCDLGRDVGDTYYTMGAASHG